MEDRVSASLAQPRLRAIVLGAFAALALLLAGVGTYGVVSYSARQRTREIGIRMAIGASSRAILTLLLGRGLVLVGMGLAAVLYGRGHQRDTDRIHVALEQLLDRLERGDSRPALKPSSPGAGTLGRIADELRKSLDF